MQNRSPGAGHDVRSARRNEDAPEHDVRRGPVRKREERKYQPTARRITSGSNRRHLKRPQTKDGRSIGQAYQLKPPNLQDFPQNRKIGSLFEDPSGEVALDMPRLSKRWQILELYRFNGPVYATPTLIAAYVFR